VELAGRVALVTGAGHRVGRALAVALGGRGMRVAVHYRGAEAGAAETCRLAVEAGGEAHPFRADLAQPDAPAALVDAVAAHFGALDVLVNSAAVMERTPVGEVTPERWDAMFAVNLRAPFFAARRRRGTWASAAGRRQPRRPRRLRDVARIRAARHHQGGVVQMTRALARALAPRVRVNAIAPGVVMLPPGGTARPERLRRTTPCSGSAPNDVVARPAHTCSRPTS
jgi:pteridine reductase